MSKQKTTITAELDRLLKRCLTLDDCQITFLAHYAERIAAGEDVDQEKAWTEWQAFKAQWKKDHAASAPAESRKKAQA